MRDLQDVHDAVEDREGLYCIWNIGSIDKMFLKAWLNRGFDFVDVVHNLFDFVPCIGV